MGISVSDRILDRGVKVLQRLVVLHLSAFDTLRITTGAGFAEVLKTAREFAMGVFDVFEV